MSLSFTPPDSQGTRATNQNHTIDPLVAQTAQKLADVSNDFQQQLNQRDKIWGSATGRFEFSFQPHHFELVVVPGQDGDACPITVHAALNLTTAMPVLLTHPPTSLPQTNPRDAPPMLS
jgi:hypothetical protein